MKRGGLARLQPGRKDFEINACCGFDPDCMEEGISYELMTELRQMVERQVDPLQDLLDMIPSG